MDPLARALLTAACVAALLALARRFGQRLAGWLTGLPIVTLPALGWLALDRGAGFAATAAAGCVAAGAGCALFGIGYAWASRQRAPAAALATGALAAALPLPWWSQVAMPLPVALPFALLSSLLACACGIAALRVPGAAATRPRTVPGSLVLSAGTAGLVSGAVSWAAGELGAFWSGVCASAPLVAAVLAVRLHREGGSPAATLFLRGYLDGIAGRSCLVALFALLAARAAVHP
ncbi:hypothetical protein [Piscinibacter defluvii]|uniref:hypothetical protein n=1 Tax=Piscinibacter defluvii TaxID=1796922 RepID=UPI000FDE1CDE|nr:hypothetical protein [Piscinibacter defluvii]